MIKKYVFVWVTSLILLSVSSNIFAKDFAIYGINNLKSMAAIERIIRDNNVVASNRVLSLKAIHFEVQNIIEYKLLKKYFDRESRLKVMIKKQVVEQNLLNTHIELSTETSIWLWLENANTSNQKRQVKPRRLNQEQAVKL